MARTFAAASSQYLEYAGAVLTAHPITIATWFNTTTVAGTFGVICQIGNLADAYFWLARFGSTIEARLNNGGTSQAASQSTVSINTWHHGAAVFASSTSRTAYLDGAAGAANTNGMTPTSVDTTRIGGRVSSANYFDGRLGEIGIWNVALSAQDVADLAAGYSPLMIRPDALVAYWPLIGAYSPEIDEVGSFPMTLTNTPTQGDHPVIIYPAGAIEVMKAQAAAGGTTILKHIMQLAG